MLTIDRFEEDMAVCEDENREMIHINKCLLPSECREGDTLMLQDGMYIVKDNSQRKEAMRSRMQSLFKR